MARGKKTTEEAKERLKAVIYLNPDAPKTDISRETGILHADWWAAEEDGKIFLITPWHVRYIAVQ